MYFACFSRHRLKSADRTMDLKKIHDEDRESMFGSVFGVSGPGMHCLLLLNHCCFCMAQYCSSNMLDCEVAGSTPALYTAR